MPLTNPYLGSEFTLGLQPVNPMRPGFRVINDPRRPEFNVISDPVFMGTSAPALQNGLFNPNLKYGSGQNMYDSPFVRDYISPLVPRGEFERTAARAGGVGNNRRGEFIRSLFDRTQAGYQGAVLSNPELSYRDYLNNYVGSQGLANQWRAATASQRGLNPASRTTRIMW